MRQAMKDASVGQTGKTADLIRKYAPEGKRLPDSGWKVKRGEKSGRSNR